jgi:hypothetical protein
MKYILILGLVMIGCANVKVLNVDASERSKIVFLDRKTCNSPCSIKIDEKDSSIINISATSLTNYFTKHTMLHNKMFEKDTTIFFKF